MSSANYSMLIRRLYTHSRPYTTVAAASTTNPPVVAPDPFRTTESSPSNHSWQHIGKFYKHSPAIKKQLFSYGGLPRTYEKQLKTFTESCLMVREPALEIMHYIKSSDLANRPTVRYVLYGNEGVGKSLTMAHLLHYGHENDFVLVHVPWLPLWFKHPKEKANSDTHEECLDLPLDAAAWLIHFKAQNGDRLTRLQLKCSRDYVWNKRESTPANSPIMDLVEHGIARVKFACDVVAALLAELKQQSSAGKCRTMVCIDGYNAFFYPHTKILGDNRVKITPDKITLTQPFVDITAHDWTNGVCVLSVDRIALDPNRNASFLPRYLLGKEGFEHLDPFVPVRVSSYSDLEFDRAIEYYLERKWIQNSAPGFDKELKFLSGSNPYQLMELCKSL